MNDKPIVNVLEMVRRAREIREHVASQPMVDPANITEEDHLEAEALRRKVAELDEQIAQLRAKAWRLERTAEALVPIEYARTTK